MEWEYYISILALCTYTVFRVASLWVAFLFLLEYANFFKIFYAVMESSQLAHPVTGSKCGWHKGWIEIKPSDEIEAWKKKRSGFVNSSDRARRPVWLISEFFPLVLLSWLSKLHLFIFSSLLWNARGMIFCGYCFFMLVADIRENLNIHRVVDIVVDLWWSSGPISSSEGSCCKQIGSDMLVHQGDKCLWEWRCCRFCGWPVPDKCYLNTHSKTLISKPCKWPISNPLKDCQIICSLIANHWLMSLIAAWIRPALTSEFWAFQFLGSQTVHSRQMY